MRIKENTPAWLFIALGVQFLCQFAMLFGSFSVYRTILRMIPFLVGLTIQLARLERRGRHPAQPACLAALCILMLNAMHPYSNSMLCCAAVIALNLAIMSPLFWASGLALTRETFGRMVLVLWLWHSASAAVGVLQIYYPGSFQPVVSSVVLGMDDMTEGLKISLADGSQIWRPMGLTDTPGGAATSGMYAFLFGLAYFVTARQQVVRAAAGLSMFAGMFCIYMSHIRSIFIMTIVASLTYSLLLYLRGRYQRALLALSSATFVAVAGLAWAAARGGEGVVDRFSTLVAEAPTTVYYTNRGLFLANTLEELAPTYPLGAGLGRWGMMRGYFGDETLTNSAPLWAEIQLTGWLLDGGIPLIFAYGGAVALTIWVSTRIAMRARDPRLAGWAAVVVAYDVSAVAITFNAPLFAGQGGMEFWLFNAALFAAARFSAPEAVRARPPV